MWTCVWGPQFDPVGVVGALVLREEGALPAAPQGSPVVGTTRGRAGLRLGWEVAVRALQRRSYCCIVLARV